jgi:DNA repair exonuclease SbcCD ATPase subunit
VIAAIEAWAHYGAVKNLVHVEATCPKCDHIFLTNGEVPEPPTTPLPELRAEQRRHDNWSSPLPPEPAGGMTMTDAEIQKGRIALARVNEKLKLIDELAGLPILEDRSDTLAGERRLRAEWAAYVVAKEGWEKRSAAAVEAKAALEQLGEVIDNTHELEAALLNARVYENQVEAYAKARAEFDRISLEITEKVRKADAYKHGAEALVSARTTVKAYLAPALTRVASTLIHQMTNGVFSSVIVDEEMNISVDGQAVETLSGAGATVANVALRVALGQVLVSRVFPVFLADELDSDMDAERSQATIESLANLREQIGQLIIITHKRLGETLMIPGEYHHVDLDNSQPTT